MDPNATLDRWREAMRDQDLGEVRDSAADLLNWLAKGGAMPTNRLALAGGREDLIQALTDTLSGAVLALNWRP